MTAMNPSKALNHQGHRLLQLGVALFLLTSFEGFAIPYVAVPLAGRSAYSLSALLGIMLIALGLVWPRLRLGAAAGRTAFWLLIYSGLAITAAFLTAAVCGAGKSTMPLSGAAQGTPFQELIIAIVAYSSAPTGITAFALILWGLRGETAPSTAQPREGGNDECAISGPRGRVRAVAKVTVQSSQAEPYDQTASPVLIEVRLSETFTGDIDGDSPVRALEVRRDDRSANLVSMQRFRGTLGGRQGTFVLQGQETVENGKISATWFVVPGSGTGDLSRLRGEGGFEGEFGKGSDATLEYWFE
jgi:hydroxylaminobenzene mutase